MVLILHQSGASHGHGLPAKRSQGSGHNHGHSHGHNHGHSHGHNHGHGNGHNHGHGNASVQAAFVHVVGDLVQSIGVMVAAAIIYFRVSVDRNTPSDAKLILVQSRAPQDVAVGSVKERLLSLRGVASLHSLHAWSLNTNRSLVSAHLVTEGGADAPRVLAKASKLLRSEFGFSSVTIQVEH
ncbi:Zinc transporter 3 [Liparis tanakae]|uniref:Zinc transporter 3 n=1 Tax=Liparis tanakae TaxID=230148 RepID=A0A4Z2IJP4_9TELE|nr:Zinc transporter 3 [Liparis tanakae]